MTTPLAQSPPLPCSIYFLGDDEAEKLILSACGSRPHTEEELDQLIEWAEDAKAAAMFLEMVMKGSLVIQWGDGEPIFSSVNADLTRPEAQ